MTTICDSPSRVRISTHAVHRWMERVDPGATSAEARLALGQFLSCGRARPTPRHWTDVEAAPGLRFVYWSGRSAVCALVIDGVAVTVITRDLCRTSSPRSAAALRAVDVPAHRRGRRVAAEAAWRWDGRRDAA